MQHLSTFILSEGDKYQQLQPSSQNINPQKAPGSPPKGLDGWSYMMCTPKKDFALLYFENKSALPKLSGFKRKTSYHFQWFNPRDGQWEKSVTIKTDRKGILQPPAFPDGQNPSTTDWAAKISK